MQYDHSSNTQIQRNLIIKYVLVCQCQNSISVYFIRVFASVSDLSTEHRAQKKQYELTYEEEETQWKQRHLLYIHKCTAQILANLYIGRVCVCMCVRFHTYIHTFMRCVWPCRFNFNSPISVSSISSYTSLRVLRLCIIETLTAAHQHISESPVWFLQTIDQY